MLESNARLLSTLGPGEIRFSDRAGDRPTEAHLHHAGERVATIHLAVHPPLEVAFEASAYVAQLRDGKLPAQAMSALSGRLSSAASHLAAAIFDGEAEGLVPTDALRETVRDAWLVRRRLHAKRLLRADVLPTTTGAYVSLEDVYAEAAARGSVWYTGDPTLREAPTGERAFALVLSDDEVETLERLADGPKLADRSALLQRLARRRENLARPRETTLAARERLPESVRAGVLTIAEIPPGDDGLRGSVALLVPSHARFAALYPHRDMLALEKLTCPSPWPAVAFVDQPGLSVDFTSARVQRGVKLEALRKRVRETVEGALRDRFAPEDAKGTIPWGTATLNARGGAERGRLALTDPTRGGQVLVRGTWTERVTKWPLRGELWSWKALKNEDGERRFVASPGENPVQAAKRVREAYARMLGWVADARRRATPSRDAPPWARAEAMDDESREWADAHLLWAALAGVLEPERVPGVIGLRLAAALGEPVGEADDLSAKTIEIVKRLLDARVVFICDGEALDALDPASRAALSRRQLVVRDDGDLLSRTLIAGLGTRARELPRRLLSPTAPPQASNPRRGRSAPSRAASRLTGLDTEVQTALRGVLMHTSRIEVAISPRRSRRLLDRSPGGPIVLGGAHPSLTRALAHTDFQPGGARRDELIQALCAHALAILEPSGEQGDAPGATALGDPAHLGALTKLAEEALVAADES